jgi:hypothetical protein
MLNILKLIIGDPTEIQLARGVQTGNLIPLGDADCPMPGYEDSTVYTDTPSGHGIWHGGGLYEKVSNGIASTISKKIHSL